MYARSIRMAAALLAAGGLWNPAVSPVQAAEKPDPQAVASQVDRLLLAALAKSKTPAAPLTSDNDFLRRVTFDLTGRLPSPREITMFRLNPASDKRSKVVRRLLESDDYARNWAWYWRDVIMTRATDQRARLAQRTFETWLAEQFRQNRSWDAIVTDLLTATGDVREKGEAALIFAHNGDAKELAAETSRIFLGIQIQCANCHDHPTDIWKREQFHQLAAYFPRIGVRPVRDPDNNRIRSFEVVSAEYGRRGGFFDLGQFLLRFDKNKDGKITKAEVQGTPAERNFDRLLRFLDRDRDGALSKTELDRIRRFGNRRRGGGVEYYMPNPKDPSSRGTRMDPVFFVGSQASPSGLKDLDRRKELARLVTSPENKWFARAFVNRLWTELLGEGFYMPLDDLGPQRKARFPEVLEALAEGFTHSGYDVKWLLATITSTQAYQRQIRAREASETSVPFASARPTRLRSDQVYNALTQALGVSSLSGNRFFGRRRGGYRGFGSERFLFSLLFSFDPSTPQEDILGTVPQALYLMNSPSLNRHIRGTGETRLGRILRDSSSDKECLSELYLMVLSREPSAKEERICRNYIAKVGNRTEAFEDILWSLLNSSEFLTKR